MQLFYIWTYTGQEHERESYIIHKHTSYINKLGLALMAGEFSSVLHWKKLIRYTGILMHYQLEARSKHFLNGMFKRGIKSDPWHMKPLHSCVQLHYLLSDIKLPFLYTTPTWKTHDLKYHLLSGHYIVDGEALVTFSHSHNWVSCIGWTLPNDNIASKQQHQCYDCGKKFTIVPAMNCCSSLFYII